MIRKVLFSIGFLLLMLLPGLANAAAGHFLFVYGKVAITMPNGAARQATKGMKVEEGETITSGLHGAAQLRMEDGAFLAIRPNTVLRIDAYAFEEKGRKEESTLSLLKGTFRAITGKIGKRHPQHDLVKTPVATIGIRGTDHEPAYIPAGLPGAGAYDKVNKGKTFIKTDAGTLDLGANQVGHAVASNKPPVTLPSMPAFYRTPDRAAVKEQKKENKKGGGNANSGSDKNNGKSNGGNSKDQNNENGKKDSSGGKESSNTTSSDSSNGTATNSNSSGGDSGDTDTGSSSSTLVASSSHGNTTSDTTTSNADASDTSPSPTITTTTSTSMTDPSIVQNYSATGSDSSKLNLTTQTTTTAGGSTTSIGTTTYATPAASSVGAVSWTDSSYDNSFLINGQWSDTFTTDGSGNLTSWHYAYVSGTDPHKEVAGVVNGMSGTPQQWRANSYATTGITFGAYNANTVDLTLANNTTSSNSLTVGSVNQTFNWITGPGVSPIYLPQAYRGTATFAVDGGYAIDESGAMINVGNKLSGSASIDFSKQSLAITVTAYPTPGGKWAATASNVPLDWNSFNASSSPGHISNFGVTYCSDAACTHQYTGHGGIQGALTGSGMTGLISSFAFSAVDGSFNTRTLSGVEAFVNTAGSISSSINHRAIFFASYDPRTSLSNPYFTPSLLGAFTNNTSNITYDATNNITSFTSTLPYYYSSGSNYYNPSIPVQLRTTGAVSDTGTDAVTGISWGRWSGSTSSAALDGLNMPTFNPPYLHYIAGPTTNQAVQLPTSGTYSYTLAGGTHPTDNLGNVGTLNSASLTANFTNMTVDVGVSATAGSTTLTAAGTGIPIQGPLFHAGGNGGAPLTVTCSGACSSINDGEVGGSFTGSTGNGAAMAYSLGTHASGATGTVISGVAAFHR